MEAFKPATHRRSNHCEIHGAHEENGLCLVPKSRIIWLGCPSCNEARETLEAKERALAQERERQKMIETRLQTAGIPLRFRDRDFENYLVNTPGQQHAYDTAKRFVDDFKQHAERGTFVIFSGKPGTGKSHLAIAIAQQIMQHGTAMYLNAMDLIRMVRNTWQKNSCQSETQVLTVLGSINLLVLDEIGSQYGTEGEQLILFDVLDRRYRDLHPTILLTNLSKSGMKEFIGERSFDRMRENGIWIPFDWSSYRGRKAA